MCTSYSYVSIFPLRLLLFILVAHKLALNRQRERETLAVSQRFRGRTVLDSLAKKVLDNLQFALQ